MFKSTVTFLFLATLSLGAMAELRIERMSRKGAPERFEFQARWSAKKRVRYDCEISGGGVVNSSTFIDSCERSALTGNYQCSAQCDCAHGGSRAGR